MNLKENVLMKNLTIPETEEIAQLATKKRDKELREIGCSKEPFSPADVRIIINEYNKNNG